MKDLSKTKKQLIDELTALRKQAFDINKEHFFHLSVISNAAEGISVCHNIREYPYDKFTVWNNRMTEITGYTMEEINKYGWYQKVYPDPETQARAVERMKRMRHGDDLRAEPWEITRKDGEKRILSITTSIIESEDGSVHVMAIMDDITEQKRASEAILQVRRDWENIFQAIGHPTIILDAQHNILSANRATVKAVGVDSIEELIGRKCYEIFHNSSEPPKGCPMVKMLNSTKLEESEMEVEALGGIFLVSCTPVFDEKGNIQKIIHIATDITNRKQAEEALRDSENRFKTLFEKSAEAQLLMNHEGKVVDCNDAFLDFFALQGKTEIIGHSPEDFAPEFQPDGTLSKDKGDEILKTVLERGSARYEWAHFKHDASRTPVLTELICTLISIAGRPMLHSAIRDITERKKVEEALHVSEEKYHLVVENANDAIFIVQNETIKFPNRQMIAFTGHAEEELTSVPFSRFIHQDDREMVANRHRERLQGRDVPATYSFKIVNKSGDTIWVEASIVLVTWEGSPASLVFLRDITFQKKLEAQLLQAQKMEGIGQLAGGVAHDFNNLLTAIIGYGHLLKKEANQDDRTSTYVGQILSAAERAAILTNDLLTFSRKQIINPKPVNLNKIIKDMESLLLRVIGEDIELSTVLTDTHLTIMADSTQIDQILLNLATNAQDAMPKGGSLIIRTDRVELNGEYTRTYGYGKPGPYALLSVEDTGTGMAEDIRGRIFEPFFTTKEVGKGTGLGLSMVYGIVKQHDGYINVYSAPGRGTTFKILLPLIQLKVKKIKPENLQNVKGGTETILIVEDDKQVRSLLKEILTNAGYHIIEAVDGDDAVEVFQKNKDNVHLLILDVIMPKKNGKEVYNEIKKVRSDMKVIFISGYSADIIYKKGILEVGMNFISKPVSPDDLLTKVRNVLDA
jgi:two-component system cell cycle sensor histidine kinase/response regulator CckA